jgi:DNA ligase-1
MPMLVRFLLAALLCFISLARAEPPGLLLANTYRSGLALADYWVSEKYDGVRGYWDGTQLLTRGGRRIAAPPWFTAGWPTTPLDGELWAGHGRFAVASSTTAREEPNDDAWRQMRYHVFDLPAHPGRFDDRLTTLQATVARIDQPWVLAVRQSRIGTDKELQALMRRTVKAGGEGVMLHRGSSLYRAERSDDLIKLKPHDDAEGTVVTHLPGKGRHAGRMGALLLQLPSGQRFRVGTGFTDADRDDPPPIGSTVTYRYRGLHDSGLPRFASFLRVRRE